MTRTDGKIVRLFVQEKQMVRAGACLAYLESTADHDKILRLIRQLRTAWKVAQGGNLEGLEQINLSGYNQLGELQSTYQVFEQAHIQMRAYLNGGFYSQKKVILQQEIGDLRALAQQLTQQRVLQTRDALLAQEEYAVHKQLAENKVIAALELKREESKNIGRQLAYQQVAMAIINNKTSQRAKKKEILEIDKEVAEGRDQFLQALNTLLSAAEAWQSKYILIAPVSGCVHFTGILQENQVVAAGKEIFYVAPPNTGYIGQLRIPQHNAGKVQVGQEVLVRFSGFPYQEFGIVRGRIVTIADISSSDSAFLAKVELPAGLKTSYGRSLTYKTGMTASADIITADEPLLMKLFYQFRKIQKAG
ncbi:HlyD family efflux transporter periplasmic adaptor subunit [Hymenobacter koreensis]|uniref:HlyD family efflux transporter periplasmic adaptor subunit n=2 Tax=Hymenobacter koreensis TaxID=1084523 RepID=A0ABP8JPS8_9BACT